MFYTSNYGTPELRKAIAEKLKRDNNVDYTADEILVTIGVGEGTYAAVAAFLNPGDQVLVPDPVWLNYIHVPNFFGAVPVSYKLREVFIKSPILIGRRSRHLTFSLLPFTSSLQKS